MFPTISSVLGRKVFSKLLATRTLSSFCCFCWTNKSLYLSRIRFCVQTKNSLSTKAAMTGKTPEHLSLDDVLYPVLEASRTGMLEVSPLHSVAWEVSGCETGIPVMVLHGGPGGGSQPEYRRYFDPKVYKIVQMDQRGSGKSTPHAELSDNNTQALIEDIEKLRGFLGIDTWYVFGGSWGSTLSLCYAISHPERVKALMLRGIFMCRRSELLWFYQEGASHIFPDKFQPYREHIPEAERGDLIAAYYRRLTSSDRSVRNAAAKEWCLWEMGTSKLIPDTKYIDKADDLDFAAAFSRIECHYFMNAIFLEDSYILKNCGKLSSIPVHIVQGRYDVVCPATSAWELHSALPHSTLEIVADAGHSMGEVGIARELVNITNKYR